MPVIKTKIPKTNVAKVIAMPKPIVNIHTTETTGILKKNTYVDESGILREIPSAPKHKIVSFDHLDTLSPAQQAVINSQGAAKMAEIQRQQAQVNAEAERIAQQTAALAESKRQSDITQAAEIKAQGDVKLQQQIAEAARVKIESDLVKKQQQAAAESAARAAAMSGDDIDASLAHVTQLASVVTDQKNNTQGVKEVDPNVSMQIASQGNKIAKKAKSKISDIPIPKKDTPAYAEYLDRINKINLVEVVAVKAVADAKTIERIYDQNTYDLSENVYLDAKSTADKTGNPEDIRKADEAADRLKVAGSELMDTIKSTNDAAQLASDKQAKLESDIAEQEVGTYVLPKKLGWFDQLVEYIYNTLYTK